MNDEARDDLVSLSSIAQPGFYDGGALIPMAHLKTGELANADQFDDMISSSAFLPRIQLYGSSSDAVKEDKIKQGTFGLVRSKDRLEELGKSIDCIPVGWRFKAMQIADGDVLSVFDSQSADFRRIQEQSEEQNSGCMYGVEFLIWLPDSGEGGEFVTYFLSSKSARREASPLRGLLGKGANIEVKLIVTKKFKWHAPAVSACSTPMANLPDMEKLNKELERFNNPKTGKEKEPGSDVKDSGNPDRER